MFNLISESFTQNREYEYKSPLHPEQCISIINEAGHSKKGLVRGAYDPNGFRLWIKNTNTYSFNGSLYINYDGTSLIKGVLKYSDFFVTMRKASFVLMIVALTLTVLLFLFCIIFGLPLYSFTRMILILLLGIVICLATPIICKNYERYIFDFIHKELMGTETSGGNPVGFR